MLQCIVIFSAFLNAINMTKQEKIQKEWDNLVSNSQIKKCENTGFAISYCVNGISDLIEDTIIELSDIEYYHLDSDLIKWRPIHLKGIEENNGWNKIESKNDLPINIESRKIIFRTKEGMTTTYFSEDIVSEIPNHFLRYSHWRIKDEILEPVF